MSKNSKQYQNKRKPKRVYTKPPQLTKEQQEAADREFYEKYREGGVIKNTIRIWRDTSPKSFITYFPVIIIQALYAVTWFLASIFIFFSSTQSFGYACRDGITFCSSAIASFGMPLLLTILHLKYSIKNEKKYFWNSILYALPACAIYVVLDFLDKLIAVMFSQDRASIIYEMFRSSGYISAAMLACCTIFGCIAQIILVIHRRRSEAMTTKLGVKIDRTK